MNKTRESLANFVRLVIVFQKSFKFPRGFSAAPAFETMLVNNIFGETRFAGEVCISWNEPMNKVKSYYVAVLMLQRLAYCVGY